MPPAYVKPYVKRQKNDAEAICEAVSRPNMRFVATKTPEQQSCLTLHRTRHLLMRQQTSVINAIRSHLAEFGIVAPAGRNGVEALSLIQTTGGCPGSHEPLRGCGISEERWAELTQAHALSSSSSTPPLRATKRLINSLRLRNETEGLCALLVDLLLGLVAGYCVILFTWVGYTNLVRVNDFEGAASMQVAFFFAQSAHSSPVCARNLVADAQTLAWRL